MATSREEWTRNKHSLISKLQQIIILFLFFKIPKEYLENNILYFYNQQA